MQTELPFYKGLSFLNPKNFIMIEYIYKDLKYLIPLQLYNIFHIQNDQKTLLFDYETISLLVYLLYQFNSNSF